MKTLDKQWTEDSHHILEQATNLDHYNQWLIGNFREYFGKKILEIGSGLGGLSYYLPKEDLTVSDLRDDYFDYLNKEFGYKTLKLDIENQSPRELRNTFDTLFSSNVFEHIKDDRSAFLNCLSLLKTGGKLLLFVPARKEIFGQLDRDMGHYRRYTREELINKAKEAGFGVLETKYVNLPGYFTWWGRGVVLGKLIKNKPGNSGADNFLAKLFDLAIVPLLKLEKLFKAPFGQSLILIAEKP